MKAGHQTGNCPISIGIKIKYDPDNRDLFISDDCIFYDFPTLPYFKSRELASRFIEEFGAEIIEVFC